MAFNLSVLTELQMTELLRQIAVSSWGLELRHVPQSHSRAKVFLASATSSSTFRNASDGDEYVIANLVLTEDAKEFRSLASLGAHAARVLREEGFSSSTSKNRDKKANFAFYIPRPEAFSASEAEQFTAGFLDAMVPQSGVFGGDIDLLTLDLLEEQLSSDLKLRRSFHTLISDDLSLGLLRQSGHASLAEVSDIMNLYALQALRSEMQVSLTQAGGTGDERARLTEVFFDPQWRDGSANEGGEGPRVCLSLVKALDMPSGPRHSLGTPLKFVLVGGPGQGKTTASKFLAQHYRTALLGLHGSSLTVEAARSIAEMRHGSHELGIPEPRMKRYPLQVSLGDYAAYLLGKNRDPKATRLPNLSNYILSTFAERGFAELAMRHLEAWIREWPILLLLDGMDETPPELRQEILERISDFEEYAHSLNGDVALIVTTRPQGSTTDFSPTEFKHMQIELLSAKDAGVYASKVVLQRHQKGSDAARTLLARVRAALVDPGTQRLMSTPLQVTIMTLLLEQQEKSAKSRYQMFDGYFQVVYRREANKPGFVGDFVRDHEGPLVEIHERAAFSMQLGSESATEASSALRTDQLLALIEGVLERRGFDTSKSKTLNDMRSTVFDRLVLLVSKDEDYWEFEIRSLQEYMAARHVTEGESIDDAARASFFRATAVSFFWRNVWTLAAGRILTDRSMYRELIMSTIADLDTADSVAISYQPSAGLALSLLEDDAAAGRPADARVLLNLVLRGMGDFDSHEMKSSASITSRMLATDRNVESLISAAAADAATRSTQFRMSTVLFFKEVRLLVEGAIRAKVDRILTQLNVTRALDQSTLTADNDEMPLDEGIIRILGFAGHARGDRPVFPSRDHDLPGIRFGFAKSGDRDVVIMFQGLSDENIRQLATAFDVDVDLAEAISMAEPMLRDVTGVLAHQMRLALSFWRGRKMVGELLWSPDLTLMRR